MEENAALSAKSLIEQENRQYNETNALYHAAAVQFGLSDTAFWILYALYSSAAPLTQVQMCAEWCLPKQTLNSAVRSMVEQGLLVLTPAPGGKRAKNLNLTEAGRALAEKTIARVAGRRRQPYAAWGWSAWKQTLPSGRDTCRNCGKNLHS